MSVALYNMVQALAVTLLILIPFAIADPIEIKKESTTRSTTSTERVDINKTVSEVEKILDNYPELPRIDRSEILSILQNITEEDNARLKEELTGVLEEEKQKMENTSKENEGKKKNSIQAKNETRVGGSRSGSVMVVMPFKPEEQQESLEELYTKSPIVRMEKQRKVSTESLTEKIASTTPVPYSIVEKEDSKFNPPLRVIGFRYHTTPAPGSSPTDAPRTYTNFQNPEQVTMAFTRQEFVPSHGWNHKGFQQTISTSEAPQPEWETTRHQKVVGEAFHVPMSVDNFSLEDAMIQNTVAEEPGAVLPNAVKDLSDVSFTTTTPKVYITSDEPDQVHTDAPLTTTARTTTTSAPTTEVYRSTTAKSLKRKTKPSKKTTTTTPQTDLASVIDNLPPHLKNMLSNLGVDQDSPAEDLESQTSFQSFPIRPTVDAEIDPSSYYAFKPIPTKRRKTLTDDMQNFLATFGLIDGNRQQKAAAETATKRPDDKFLDGAPEINTDFLTDSMKDTLTNLGLYEHDSTTKKSQQRRNHIFNPKTHTGAQSDEEVRKLNALLTTIRKLASLNDSEPVTPEFQSEILRQVKELDNITISYKTSEAINEEIHKILDRNQGKFKIPIVMKESSAINTLPNGLNPEFYEEIQLKNEVKRQENGTSTTEGSTTSTTEEPANSEGLEDSFGGGETAPVGSNPAESLPPKRPNGLYLLLDWNTFFEVGTEDDARRVNIRFQPKIGDGRNFLPVSIP